MKLKYSLPVAMLALVGYSYPSFAQTTDSLEALRKAGHVKVAIASIPPYLTVSPSGEAAGPSIELQKLVLKGIGLPTLSPVLTGWDSMIPGLLAHQFDYLGAGWNITEEGCKVALFSTPYYATRTALFVPLGNPKHLKSLADVAQRADIKIAMLPGTDSYSKYTKSQGVKSEQITIIPDFQAGAATVTGGRADAFVVGQFSIPNPREKGLEVIPDEHSPVFGSGAVFRKEDKAFRDAFNEQLIGFIKDGTFTRLYGQYYNGDTMAKLLSRYAKASDLEPSCE
ncbi:hypothetical protein XI06_16650 [Bradyrhizobium sp. CCBAU 11434]|uniref:transporter substrate-binding domain-containing protein n=1 Tax=Bradyrhizobium sp. CCBAU 11434 TaxID=1630885 RepID=UPI0023055217|nr:transporter substrate-binding domain-containing protein [Bradyrhizobium sp. CCBAU 11434]MDA9521895.1 hypothetical protein [Bradyrhizobium sp. CCBAU 11434]